MNFDDIDEWPQLSPEEKRRQLYLRQVKTLNDFLERGAISKEQYEKSFGYLTEKMGYGQPFNDNPKNSTIPPIF